MRIPEAPSPIDDACTQTLLMARGRSALFELSIDMLATLDRGGHFTDVNPAAERILGWTREQLIGRDVIELVHPEDEDRTLALQRQGPRVAGEIFEFENRLRCKDGTYRWLQWNARLADRTWYAVARDITDHMVLQDRAVRDPLTGLPNRAGLSESLNTALARLDRHPGLLAVLFVDLDHFKVVNDHRGHEVGDRFLCAAATRLLEAVRDIDAVARFGGDEFVILLEDIAQPADAAEIAARVAESLRRSIVIGGEEAMIGASVGVALTSSSGSTPESLLREADVAMYRAKRRGRGGYAVFEEDAREGCIA